MLQPNRDVWLHPPLCRIALRETSVKLTKAILLLQILHLFFYQIQQSAWFIPEFKRSLPGSLVPSFMVQSYLQNLKLLHSCHPVTCVATRRFGRSLGDGEAMYWQEKTSVQAASLFTMRARQHKWAVSERGASRWEEGMHLPSKLLH